MILMIPDTPSGSNFAEGFVTISMFSIELAGICCKASFGSIIVGLPSINNVKLPLPLNSTFPSISTFTDGTFSKTSTAEPDIAVFCSLTFITFLSMWYSTGDLFAVTTALSNSNFVGFSLIVSRSKILIPLVSLISSKYLGS